MIAIDLPEGSNSFSNSICFIVKTVLVIVRPVRLPPGRLRLAASPDWTGSPGVMNTMAIVAVAAFAARAAGMPLTAAMTANALAQVRPQVMETAQADFVPSGTQS
jgi:hypothetical protein